MDAFRISYGKSLGKTGVVWHEKQVPYSPKSQVVSNCFLSNFKARPRLEKQPQKHPIRASLRDAFEARLCLRLGADSRSQRPVPRNRSSHTPCRKCVGELRVRRVASVPWIPKFRIRGCREAVRTSESGH